MPLQLGEDESLAILHTKLAFPELPIETTGPHYSYLMENLSRINARKKLRYVNAVLQWLAKSNGEMLPKNKQYFGEDLEHRLGYVTNSSTKGDILGLELKGMNLISSKSSKKSTTALRLTTKISTEFATLLQGVINSHYLRVRQYYSDKKNVVYYGDYYERTNQTRLSDDERSANGFLLNAGEVLKCGKESKLGTVKIDINSDGYLVIFVKPPGYSRWYSRTQRIRIRDVFSKFSNGMVLVWAYPRKRESERIILSSYYVAVNQSILVSMFKQGKIGLEIRYGGGGRGRFDSSGDAMQLSRPELEKLIFESNFSTPISPDFRLQRLQ